MKRKSGAGPWLKPRPGAATGVALGGGPAAVAVALLLVAALAFQYGRALGMPFLGDDYSILDKVRGASFAELWQRNRLLYYWYRPWSRELHYWWIERAFGIRERPFHLASFALWIGVMLSYFTLARRLIGGRAAAVACAGIAALAAWAGTLMWVAGVQELWMLLWALLFLHAFAARAGWLALLGFALALLSKETAAVLPAIALAWALAVDRDPPLAALARIAPLAALLAGWLLFHPWLWAQLHGPLAGNTEVLSRLPSAVTAQRFALSLVNLDERPAPADGVWPALRAGLAGPIAIVALVLLALVARAAPRGTPRARGGGAVGTVWTLAGALPLFAPSIGWHAYYGLLGALGAWLLIAPALARRPALALLIVGAVACLRPLRAATPSWDWSSMAYQERAGFFLGRLRDDLLRQHPAVSPHSRFYFSRVPQNIGLVVGDGAALRIWYRDSTLRGGFLSDYRPRDPGTVAAGPDFFLRYDSTATWVEVVKGAEDLAAARARNPHWETDHRELALALGRAGDWNGAIGELEKLAAAKPTSIEYALNLGTLYERTGNVERARHWYGRAAAMPGGSPAARAALIELDARVRDSGRRPPPSKVGAAKAR